MDIKQSDRAVKIARTLKQLQEEKDSRSYRIGQLGYYAREMGKDFLRANNADTWSAFLAENNMSISTVNNYVGLYRLYGEDGIDLTEEQWTEIGPRKLRIMAPVMKDYKPEILDGGCIVDIRYEAIIDSARTLSASDLMATIKGDGSTASRSRTQGTENALLQSDAAENHPPLSPAQYMKKVKESPCCICHGERDSEYAHWPRTKNHGEFGIPLCRVCHTEQESFMIDGHIGTRAEWFARNFRQIGEWLDSLIGG